MRAGKSVWGYHCVSPTPNIYLNSFVDVPLAKQRLIPWLAAQSNLTGWLYWYINYGWVHSDISSGEKAKVAPLPLLDTAGHHQVCVSRALTPKGWPRRATAQHGAPRTAPMNERKRVSRCACRLFDKRCR